MSTNALPCQYQILVSGKLEAYGWPWRWITYWLQLKTKKNWHRLDSGQISLKDKTTNKTIFRHKTKKTDLAFLFLISVVWQGKKCHSTETFHWLTDEGRDKLFVTFETLHYLFIRHRTKMDTDKNLDYYICRLFDRETQDRL